MDENNSPLSYDAPKEGEYGVDKPQEPDTTNYSSESTSSTTDSASTTSAFSLKTDNTSSGSASAESTSTQTTSSTSHQEVFGGSVEGNPSPANNNYNTNYTSPYGGAPEEYSKGFAIASLVMGILSVITCCCGIIGIIFGILGIIFYCVQPKDSEGKRPTQATVGLILSIVGLVIAAGGIIFSLIARKTDWYQDILNNAQNM